MSKIPFAPLHNHTDGSLLDGLSKSQSYFQYAHELGMPAVAITDHAWLGAHPFAAQSLKDSGIPIKPIWGIESYIVGRNERLTDKGKHMQKPFHLLMLAMNKRGYDNLVAMTSVANVHGFYNRPRIDWKLLEKYNEGIIITSGCLASELPRYVVNLKESKNVASKEFDNADALIENALKWYMDVFEGRFYFELQYRLNSPKQDIVNQWCIEKSRETGIPLIVTNDAHYARPEDVTLHDNLLCIQTRAKISNKDRMRFDEGTYCLISPDVMLGKFKEVPEAITNTVQIADRVEVWHKETTFHIPQYACPNGYNSKEYLRYLVEKGLEYRYSGQVPTHIKERADYELSIFDKMGFNDYMLLIWDICMYSYMAGIIHNTRGSAASSIVAYALGITRIEPTSMNLPFERFLNPYRVNMPDIDLDYPDNMRHKIAQYLMNRYGSENVAQIIAIGTMGARGALRDVARVNEIDRNLTEKLVEFVPLHAAPPLSEVLETSADLKEFLSKNQLSEIYDIAMKLEGTFRSLSVHPAGIVIVDDGIESHVPLHRPEKRSPKSAQAGIDNVTQFPMEFIEQAGLLKVDVLGSATLATIQLAIKYINERHGMSLTFYDIPFQHVAGNPDMGLKEAFELLGRGETVAVFQVESEGMRTMLKQMKPTKFEQIVAAISLYRPGPMDYIPLYIERSQGAPFEYKHPLLEPILSETYGIIVYQEQIIQIASNLFGYPLGEADLMRRAVSKKKQKDLIKHKSIFKERGPANGISEKISEEIFDDIEFFANYGFNKAHGVVYAAVTVMTAWLKCHYPLEYMTAHINVYAGKDEIIIHDFEDCERMGIPIFPPSVNHSKEFMSIEGEGLRVGLSQLKHVGEKSVRKVIDAPNKPYKTLDDLATNVNLSEVGKIALTALTKVGALDLLHNEGAFGLSGRDEILHVLERLIAYSKNYFEVSSKSKKDEKFALIKGDDLKRKVFDIDSEIANIEAPVNYRGKMEVLNEELDIAGIYLSGHPMEVIKPLFREKETLSILELTKNAPDENEYNNFLVSIGGTISRVFVKQDKKGRDMAFVDVVDYRDGKSSVSVTLFSDEYSKYKDMLVVGAPVYVFGKLQHYSKPYKDNSTGNSTIGRYSIVPKSVEFLSSDS